MRCGAEHRHRGAGGRGGPARRERVVGGLGAWFGGDELGEYGVDPGEYRRGGAEVGFEDDLAADPLLGLEVGGDVGAAEPVDGLLRISDHEQAALRHRHVGPAGRSAVRAGGDADGQLDLDRVGVLELIQQQPPVALLQVGADGCAVRGMGEQVTGEHEQVVEFQLPLRSPCLRCLEGRAGDAAGQAAQRGFQHGGAYRGGLVDERVAFGS